MADITERFFHSQSKMKEGDLLALEEFSYYESMSAVELMDPKLDSGMALMALPLISDRISSGEIPSNLSEEELKGLLDKQIFNFSMWIEGQSLAHTIFSCVYYQQCPEAVQSLSLRVLLQSFYKFGSILHGLIHDVSCLRDDDYSYVILEYPEWNTENEAELCNRLDIAMNNAELPELKVRIQFIRELLASVSSFANGNLQAFPHLKTLLKNIMESSFMDSVPNVFDQNYSLIKVPHAPPNKVYKAAEFTTEMCFQTLEKFIESIENTLRMRDINDYDKLLESLENLPSFDILSRTLIEKNIFVPADGSVNIFGKNSLKLMIFKSMNRAGVNTAKIKGNEEFEQYIARVEIVFKEQILLRLKNTTRRRRILGKYLSDFNILVAEADCIEVKLMNEGRKDIQNQMLFHWIFSRSIEAMIEYLQLGFTLQIYTIEDLGMIMFYLDFLYGTMGTSKGHMMKFLNSKQGKKLKKKANLQEIELGIQRLTGFQFLCRGYVRLYFLLLKEEISPVLPVEVEKARFQKRFQPLDSMAVPQKLEFEAYNSIRGNISQTEQMISSCNECFNYARSVFNTESDKHLVRVAVSNSLSISKAKRAAWKCKVHLVNTQDKVFPTCEIFVTPEARISV